MTREQLIKHWDVIKAFKKGKDIEVQNISDYNEWNYINNPLFDVNFNYRVICKQKNEYVPFDFSDAKNLIGKIVVPKDKQSLEGFHLITSIKNDYLYFYDGGCNMNYLFKYFTFIDGSICGKKK